VTCYTTSVFVVAKLMQKVIILTIWTIGRQDHIAIAIAIVIAKLDVY